MDTLVGQWVDGLIGRLAEWLFVCFPDWLIDWFICLMGWSWAHLENILIYKVLVRTKKISATNFIFKANITQNRHQMHFRTNDQADKNWKCVGMQWQMKKDGNGRPFSANQNRYQKNRKQYGLEWRWIGKCRFTTISA